VAWYDYGKTDIEEVRAKSLELQAANYQYTTAAGHDCRLQPKRPKN
jgi:hypothetical protein